MAGRRQIIRVGRYDVEITRPAKVLFPEDGITKGDLIDYYRRIAPWILPHLRARPLATERYPDGIDKTRIFQKNLPSYYPDWEQRKSKRGGRVFVDTNRNAYAQTIAPAFAVRARPGASVSTTLNWSELKKKDLRPDGVNIRSIFERLEKVGDPWKDFRRHAISLKRARRKIEELNVTRRIPHEEEFH